MMIEQVNLAKINNVHGSLVFITFVHFHLTDCSYAQAPLHLVWTKQTKIFAWVPGKGGKGRGGNGRGEKGRGGKRKKYWTVCPEAGREGGWSMSGRGGTLAGGAREAEMMPARTPGRAGDLVVVIGRRAVLAASTSVRGMGRGHLAGTRNSRV